MPRIELQDRVGPTSNAMAFRTPHLTALILMLGILVLSGCDGSGDAPGINMASDSQSNSPPPRNILYTSSNAAGENTVVAVRRESQDQLVKLGEYPTGGRGLGSGLGNQGALATNGEIIVVVNAGSSDISVLRIESDGLRQIDRIASGGIRPVSVALYRDLVYVLNAGSDNIAGFRLDSTGRLAALDGSLRGLTAPSGTLPAQISFVEDGTALVVTERATNMIVAFALGAEGIPVGMSAIDSSTRTPFGFAVSGRTVIVSEEDGGASNASATSSYRVDRFGGLNVVSPSVASVQSAACWVAITPDKTFAFVANTTSGTISTYRVDSTGRLTLVNAASATSARPIDVEVSRDGNFLYALNAGVGTITAFRIGSNGTLTPASSVVELPASATGLVAY